MTRKEAERLTRQADTLRSLGFTHEEAEALRRISVRLHHWHEQECGTDNGCIERDEDTGKCYWVNSHSGRRFPVRDLETGARKRLAAIIAARNVRPTTNPDLRPGDFAYYVQSDPRGAALYILRPGDVPKGGSAHSYYTRGICVY